MTFLKDGVHELLEHFAKYAKDPTSFLTSQPEIESKFKTLVKQCYDNSKFLEDRSNAPTFTLPKLIIKQFDIEQIWQQVELQNKFVCGEIHKELRTIVSNLQSSPVIKNDVTQTDESISKKDSSDDSGKKASKNVKFVVDIDDNEDGDDESFGDDGDDLGLKKYDESSRDKDDEDESLNDDDDESLRNENKCDEDKGNKDLNSGKQIFGDAPEDDNDEIKSSFETRQEKLKQHVEKLEENLLAEKPWQLKGEITANKRPENSLVHEILEFDLSSRPAPIITEEAALKLEDVIKNRIINKVWDDVERKIEPVDTPREFKKKLVLDQERSKFSLAQVYEQDYLKQRETVNPERKNKDEEEPKKNKQLRVVIDSLFRKLDALSNYHYTPLLSIAEPQIVTNLPAVTMEEAIPDATSTATLLAPEEIQGKIKGDLVSQEERTSTDKKRARRKKKVKQRMVQNEIKSKEKILEKLKPGLGNNFAKEKVKRDLERLMKDKSVSNFKENAVNGKSSKSSQQFFARLQDTVTGDDKIEKKRKRETISTDPKRIKL